MMDWIHKLDPKKLELKPTKHESTGGQSHIKPAVPEGYTPLEFVHYLYILILFSGYPKKLKLPGKKFPSSIALITHDEQNVKSIKVDQEAIQLLSTIKKPVAVLSICGPYRTGKSYFLSQVLGGDGFEVSRSMGPCTRGIWMSTSVLEFDDHVLILLDTEGMGAAQASESSSREDVMGILILVTLLSSCLIYNTMGAIRETDVQQMRYMYIIIHAQL